MNTTPFFQSKRSFKQLSTGAVAALALFTSAHVHAMGDATDAELPWVRPSAEAPLHGDQTAATTSTYQRSDMMSQRVQERSLRNSPTGDAYANEWLPVTASLSPSQTAPSVEEGLARADVKYTLTTWRAAGLLTPQSEIGDTTETLERREEFYALQTEVIQAEFLAAARAEEAALALAQMEAEQAAITAMSANSEPALDPAAEGTATGVPNATGSGTGDDEVVADTLEIVEIDD